MKRYLTFSLLFAGLIFGTLLSLQFKTEIPTSGNFAADEVEARDSLLKSYLDEQLYLQSRILALRADIEKSQALIEEQNEESNVQILNELKKKIGLTEIRGRGIEITLDDSPFASRQGVNITDAELVQASDIRDIVNILNASDSEAISVNDQRLIATSPISSVGTNLLVNNSYITPPFIIHAVGDNEIMLQRLLNESLLPSIYERSGKSNIRFKIVLKDVLTIPIYNGGLKTNYLNLVD